MTTLVEVITVVAPARDDEKLLTTVEACLDELPNATDDEPTRKRLARRIRAATDRLLNFTHLGEFAFQRYSVRVPGMADDTLMLPRTPVTNLISVGFLPSSSALSSPPGSALDITNQVELTDQEAGIIRNRLGFQWNPLVDFSLRKILTETGNPVPGTEDPNYEVVFEAGWRLPGQRVDEPAPTSSSFPAKPLPGDLEEAAIDMVVSDELNRGSSGAGGNVARIKVDSTETRFFNSAEQNLAVQFGLTPKAFHIAEGYRRAA